MNRTLLDGCFRVEGRQTWYTSDVSVSLILSEELGVGRPTDHLYASIDRHDRFSRPTSPAQQQRRQAARVSRLLALLRAHGILRKVPHTHRYHLSERGRTVVTALLTARQASTEELTKLAA